MTELEEVRSYRRKLHQFPELALREYRTTEYITAFLERLDITFEQPLETGAVAYINGNSERTFAFRADIDGLPIQEESEVDYRSRNDGRMHACGHDGHTAAMMLFIKRCKNLADEGNLKHNVVFIFQPSEETGAGARQLLDVWHPEDIEAIFGIHMMPEEDEGTVVVRDEEITASATEFRFYIEGVSAHVAAKHEGISAIEALLNISSQLTQLQHFHLDGLNRNIIHIGSLRAGEAINTVASTGYLEGTIRTYEAEDLEKIKVRMEKLAKSARDLFGAEVEVAYNEGYPPVVNSPGLRSRVENALCLLGLNVVDNEKPYLFGEDFSFYRALAPCYFVFFGCRSEERGFTNSLHTPLFDFDEKILTTVADYYTTLLNDIL